MTLWGEGCFPRSIFNLLVCICMCAHRTGLTNAFTATETKHQLLICRTWSCKLLSKTRKMMKCTCNFFLFWWGKRQRFSCSCPTVPTPRHFPFTWEIVLTKYFLKIMCVHVCVHTQLISHSRKWSHPWMHFTKAREVMQRLKNPFPSALGSTVSWVREIIYKILLILLRLPLA